MIAQSFTERLCLGIHHRHEPKRLFLMLGVYGDESGTHDGSSRTVMAGCLATVEQWQELENRWSVLLGAYGLRYIHAKEMRHGEGPFKYLGFDRRSELMRQLLSVLEVQSKFFVCVILENHDFERYYRSPDKQERKRRGVVDSKYGVCFRVFLRAVAQLANTYLPGEEMTITLEAGHKNGGAAETIFAEFKNDDPELAGIVKGVAYVDKKEAFGVQAADLLAYVYFRGIQEELLNPSRVEVNPPYVLALREGVITSFRADITPETLREIRAVQITRAQQRRWLRGAEGH